MLKETFPDYLGNHIEFLEFIRQLCNSNKIMIDERTRTSLTHFKLTTGSKSSSGSQAGGTVDITCNGRTYSVYNLFADNRPRKMDLCQIKSYLSDWSK
jgi:hypothetical protein